MTCACCSARGEAGDRQGERRLALATRAAGISVLGLFVSLLFYGLSSTAPRQGIDTQLAEGRAASPLELVLPVLTRGRSGAMAAACCGARSRTAQSL